MANPTLKVLSNGACDNPADKLTISNKFTTIKGSVQNCLVKHLLDSKGETQQCIENIGFSPACTICWFDLGECTKNKCFSHCVFSPSSGSCTKCALNDCFPDLEQCSGLTSSVLPPP